MVHSRKLLLAPAAGTALPAADAVFAQDAPPQSAETKTAQEAGGDIVVTAQRRETNLQKTPIAIRAFTASMLHDRGLVKLKNIAHSRVS